PVAPEWPKKAPRNYRRTCFRPPLWRRRRNRRYQTSRRTFGRIARLRGSRLGTRDTSYRASDSQAGEGRNSAASLREPTSAVKDTKPRHQAPRKAVGGAPPFGSFTAASRSPIDHCAREVKDSGRRQNAGREHCPAQVGSPRKFAEPRTVARLLLSVFSAVSGRGTERALHAASRSREETS